MPCPVYTNPPIYLEIKGFTNPHIYLEIIDYVNNNAGTKMTKNYSEIHHILPHMSDVAVITNFVQDITSMPNKTIIIK